MQWKIKHIFNYTDEKAWGDGYCNGGFHDKSGRLYFQEYFKHWIGVLGSGDRFLWTAGSFDPGLCKTHIHVDFKFPDVNDPLFNEHFEYGKIILDQLVDDWNWDKFLSELPHGKLYSIEDKIDEILWRLRKQSQPKKAEKL